MKFEKTEVWKRSAKLSASIYKELANLKDFGFKDDHHGRWKCRKRIVTWM